jgi:hypothetical protein
MSRQNQLDQARLLLPLVRLGGHSVRDRRYGGLIWMLWHPREWFKFGSGLDCD